MQVSKLKQDSAVWSLDLSTKFGIQIRLHSWCFPMFSISASITRSSSSFSLLESRIPGFHIRSWSSSVVLSAQWDTFLWLLKTFRTWNTDASSLFLFWFVALFIFFWLQEYFHLKETVVLSWMAMRKRVVLLLSFPGKDSGSVAVMCMPCGRSESCCGW